MLYTALHEVLSRRLASLLTIAGLVTASLGFVVLTATSQTEGATLTGDIGKAWNTPYDILVRPHGAANASEAASGSVRPNYLGGLYGGITQAQLDKIRAIEGVDVAAPVAVAGIVTWAATKRYSLAAPLGNSTFTGIRLIQQATGDAGMSTFPSATNFALAASTGTLVRERPTGTGYYKLVAGSTSVECGSPPRQTPLSCWGSTGPCPNADSCGLTADHLFDMTAVLQLPMVVAGVDPGAEAKLAGLDRCVTDGRYLTAGDQPTRGERSLNVPTIFSDHTFVDEALHVQLATATNPTVADATDPFPGATWSSIVDETISADALYRETLVGANQPAITLSNTWTQGDVAYSGTDDRLTAVGRPPDYAVFANPVFSGGGETDPSRFAPPEAHDVWFRPVTAHFFNNSFTGTQAVPAFVRVGQYDPGCLAGFNPLAGGRLEAYAPASVQLANGGLLKPTASVGGYVNLPPSILTTLAGVQAFTDPVRYSGASGAAFISVIRVRVNGTGEVGSVAEARLTRVAAQIREATGLDVDIVKGASPRTVQVQLPAGSFGRPALSVSEPWSVKGVGFRFFRAVSSQNLALFVLVLIAGIVLVGQTAYLSVSRRRQEFAVLRALGWPSGHIARLVLTETVILAMVATVFGLAVGLPIAVMVGSQAGWLQVLGVVPATFAVAVAAAIIPAWTASRAPLIQSLTRTASDRRSSVPRSLAAVGVRELLSSWRVEALLGSAVVALGAGMAGAVLVVSSAFRGQLDATVLGVYLTGQVRGFHVVAALLTLGVGTVAAAEVIALSYLERRQHLAVLRALGWPRRAVFQFMGGQAAFIAVAGGFVGALVVVVAAKALGAAPGATLSAAAATFAIAVAASGLASAFPLAHAGAGPVATALRGE